MANRDRLNSPSGSSTLLTVLVVLAVLYFARVVLMPLALAILLAFMLAPLVVHLRHWGFGRITSVATVVLVSSAVISLAGTLLAMQLADLGRKLPEYQQNVHDKLDVIRVSGGGVLHRLTQVIHTIREEVTPPSRPPTLQPGEDVPVPVEIRGPAFSPLDAVQTLLGSILNFLLMGGIVLVFVIFILVQREDLRDRLIRLAGAGRVNLTTRVLDDTARRVSRYLLAQLALNGCFGLLAGLALYFIGVPNPLLWGIFAFLFRYIPYLGIWFAALMPALVSFAVHPGWMEPLLVFGVYFGIDVLLYNFGEPLLYGSSTGISPLAVLMAAVFWTWLWGPVGLLLATPLTVCVVAIGRHVPNLEFLSIILSDDQVLPPSTRFYQRMLAMDFEEASRVAERFGKDKPVEDLYDQVIIPTLSLAEEDSQAGKLDEARAKLIYQHTRLFVAEWAERGRGSRHGKSSPGQRPPPKAEAPVVMCIPARDEADQIAALILAQCLQDRGVEACVPEGGKLAGEFVELVTRAKPEVVCVCAVPPLGYIHARYICRHLRAQGQDMKLIGVILTEGPLEELEQREPPLEADVLTSSMKQAIERVVSLVASPPAPLSQKSLSA